MSSSTLASSSGGVPTERVRPLVVLALIVAVIGACATLLAPFGPVVLDGDRNGLRRPSVDDALERGVSIATAPKPSALGDGIAAPQSRNLGAGQPTPAVDQAMLGQLETLKAQVSVLTEPLDETRKELREANDRAASAAALAERETARANSEEDRREAFEQELAQLRKEEARREARDQQGRRSRKGTSLTGLKLPAGPTWPAPPSPHRCYVAWEGQRQVHLDVISENNRGYCIARDTGCARHPIHYYRIYSPENAHGRRFLVAYAADYQTIVDRFRRLN